ncbi:hypothetical protein STSP2_01624 [Anaerohalosphaera lusitana]|uniref:Uncharacterized protein n=1 Tax=Anaerohalosphaera lusitana TaxID=1936003 RepID=A0A1U9NLL5_9BACT|nr:hypothetical protein [Anaerohalosphaera lusitana]AQT68460.1 hypothetical protein STSP2_01624 [Anaerohalosphaera lusitana]
MPVCDNFLGRLRLKAAALIVLRDISRVTIWWGFVLGFVILVLRALAFVPYQAGFWLLGSGVLLWGAAAFISFRKVPSLESVRALVDKHSGCGGLLIASDQMELGKWADSMPEPKLVLFKWRCRREMVLLFSAVVFLGACLAVPQRYINVSTVKRLNVDADVDRMSKQIDTLEEEDVIADSEAAELRKKLKQIRDEARGDDPVKTWAALDHMQKSLKNAAQEQAMADVSNTEKAAKAEALAKAMEENSGQMGEKLTDEAAAELKETIEKMAANNSALKNAMSDSLKEALASGTAKEGGQLSKEQLEQLRKALQGAQNQMAGRLGKLQDAKLIDGKMVKKAKEGTQIDPAALAAFLAENADGMGVSAAMKAYMPGKGGVSFGRGDAAMTWKDKSSETGTKFEEQILPPGSVEAMKDSKMVGVSVSDPSDTEEVEKNVGGFIDAQGGTGQATKRKILPRHKKAVQKYFEREDQ